MRFKRKKINILDLRDNLDSKDVPDAKDVPNKIFSCSLYVISKHYFLLLLFARMPFNKRYSNNQI